MERSSHKARKNSKCRVIKESLPEEFEPTLAFWEPAARPLNSIQSVGIKIPRKFRNCIRGSHRSRNK